MNKENKLELYRMMLLIRLFEEALEELKKAYETKEIEVIDPALEKINEVWKAASEEMYKAQAESGQGAPSEADQTQDKSSASDDVEDVDFEEVKD